MYWWVDVWSSDGCMLLGFLLCIDSPCEAAKQQTVVKPRCQAVTLPVKLRRQAVKQSSSQAATVAHPSCQTVKLTLLQVVRPACQAAKLHTCCLHTLSSFSCHAASKLQHTQTCESTSGPIQTRIQTDPDPIQTTTTTSSDPDHIQLRVKTCDCLVSFLASNSWFTIHQLWNSCQRYQECLQSSWIRSVNTIARPLRLSMWPLAKPQTHVEIWCHIMTTWSSSWGLGNLWIMPLYVTPSLQTSGSPRDDPDGF